MELIHIKTRTHSSRMRTARVLTVSRSIPSIQWEGGSASRGVCLQGVGSASRGVCLQKGSASKGSASGGGGVGLHGGAVKTPPVDRQHL